MGWQDGPPAEVRCERSEQAVEVVGNLETMPPTEEVVLLDDEGFAVGTEPKGSVHHAMTPLHLAFSCYVFDASFRVLLTRRALTKPTWPGVWTNSFCGHPQPDENLLDALHRRGEQELGVHLSDAFLVLPGFRYEATMPNGTRENEMCPVFVGFTSTPLRPSANEVADTLWMPWPAVRLQVESGARPVSPWCRTQIHQLGSKELPSGRGFLAASWDQLPPAARQQKQPRIT